MDLQIERPICLITPPSVFLMDERVFLTLGILRVAACLEERGYRVEMLDTSGIEGFEDAARDHARSSEAIVFGITSTTPQLPAASRIARAIRDVRPDAKIILGGPHITLINAAMKREKKLGMTGRATKAFDSLCKMFDVLVAGDGEDAIMEAMEPDAPQLVDADIPSGKLFLTSDRLNELPWPARHLVDVASYEYKISGERSLSLIAQLGCPFASVTGDSLIFTDRGFERLDSMLTQNPAMEKCVHGNTLCVHRVNRTILTKAGSACAPTIIDEGIRQVFEIKTENGITIKATAEHPFLALVEGEPTWKKLSELKKWDYLIQVSPERHWPTEYVHLETPTFPKIPWGGFPRKTDKMPSKLTEDVAWLVGFIIGDGCLPADGRPSVHVCVTPDVEDRLKSVVLEQFGVKLAIYDSSATKKMKHGWIHSRAAYDFFVKSMGILPSDKLHIPASVSMSPKTVLKAFIDGLMDADGYCHRGHMVLTTVSADLAREVACALLLLGDTPNIQKIDAANYPNSRSGTQYRVGIFNNDRIPTENALYKSSKSGKWFWRTPRQPEMFCGVRRRTLVKSGLHHPLNIDGWHYVRVESITEGLPERVYDINVPGEASFLVDGIASHNCGFCGGRESPMLRRIRTRTTKNVVGEITHLHKTYGVRGFQFYDDELNVNPKMVELMDAIGDVQERLGVEFKLRGFIKSQLFTDEQAKAMYRAGFRWILVGFESGSERILDNINKKATRDENTRCMEIADRHGLKVKALMSCGHPGESEETIMATRDWLMEVQPADFDATVITTYPGTPYFDHALRHKDIPSVWTYEVPKNGDKLHAIEVDFENTADYYKGRVGEYSAFVFTEFLQPDDIVKLRDFVETDVRAKLNIPFNQSAPAMRYEHSMGQSGPLPKHILRTSR